MRVVSIFTIFAEELISVIVYGLETSLECSSSDCPDSSINARKHGPEHYRRGSGHSNCGRFDVPRVYSFPGSRAQVTCC